MIVLTVRVMTETGYEDRASDEIDKKDDDLGLKDTDGIKEMIQMFKSC